MVGLFVILCCGTLLSFGCAKEQVVKTDETIPPSKTEEQASKKTMPAEQVKEPKIVVSEESTAGTGQEKNLQRIYFDFDSYVLTDASRSTLSADAQVLLKKVPGKVMVEGHCDERGSDEYNLALGEKRAKAAMNYLVTLGVPAERLSIISYGKEKPLDPGHGEDAWAKNRRAEFVVTK
jgi:peptidoglycan-associated lipoprotein